MVYKAGAIELQKDFFLKCWVFFKLSFKFPSIIQSRIYGGRTPFSGAQGQDNGQWSQVETQKVSGKLL